MNPLMFVNLPVTDLDTSRDFYAALGYRINEAFSDDASVCVVLSPQLCLMLLDRHRFADFVCGPVGDPAASTSAIYSLSADSRAHVDDLVNAALAHGGKPWKDPVSCGPMYGHSFTDPDGHVWETIHMERCAPPPAP